MPYKYPLWSLETWKTFLSGLGIPYEYLDRGKPCPICGGKDRFTFHMWRGKPSYLCRNPDSVHKDRSQNGDAIALMQAYFGWSYKQCIDAIEGRATELPKVKGTHKTLQPRSRVREKQSELIRGQRKARAIYDNLKPFSFDLRASLYLEKRGLKHMGDGDLWFHPEAWGLGNDKESFYHAAMIALIKDPHDKVIGVHKTFLTEAGEKIDFAPAKQVAKFSGTILGGLVRLWNPDELNRRNVLLIGEGIESTIAASMIFSMPGAAALSAVGLENANLPMGRKWDWVAVAADNDGNGVGQKAAQKLVNRLIAQGIPNVDIKLPPPGMDWNDVLLSYQKEGRFKAA